MMNHGDDGDDDDDNDRRITCPEGPVNNHIEPQRAG